MTTRWPGVRERALCGGEYMMSIAVDVRQNPYAQLATPCSCRKRLELRKGRDSIRSTGVARIACGPVSTMRHGGGAMRASSGMMTTRRLPTNPPSASGTVSSLGVSARYTVRRALVVEYDRAADGGWQPTDCEHGDSVPRTLPARSARPAPAC
jgi:hypothetical protein